MCATRYYGGTFVYYQLIVIRGHNADKDGWDTLIIIGEVLYCEREIENYSDPTLGLCSGREKRYPQRRPTVIILFQMEPDRQQ